MAMPSNRLVDNYLEAAGGLLFMSRIDREGKVAVSAAYVNSSPMAALTEGGEIHNSRPGPSLTGLVAVFVFL